MAIPSPSISSPDPRPLISPLLDALPTATPELPPPSVLALLTPILRHRVQIFSSSSSSSSSSDPDPWIRLLCYDPAKSPRLVATARSILPHPVSGELELDWDASSDEVAVRFRRLDVDTLQALVALRPLGLLVTLVYVTDEDEAGKRIGWKVGEVGVLEGEDGGDGRLAFAGCEENETTEDAEREFRDRVRKLTQAAQLVVTGTNGDSHRVVNGHDHGGEDDGDNDDDGYWDQYDRTPSRTPGAVPSPGRGPSPSPPPGGPSFALGTEHASSSTADEEAYFARYGDVQPAADPHDPDEEQAHAAIAQSVLSADQLANPGPGGTDETQETPRTGRLKPVLMDAIPEEREEEEEEEEEGEEGGVGTAMFDEGKDDTLEPLKEEGGGAADVRETLREHVRQGIRGLAGLAAAAGLTHAEFAAVSEDELRILGR